MVILEVTSKLLRHLASALTITLMQCREVFPAPGVVSLPALVRHQELKGLLLVSGLEQQQEDFLDTCLEGESKCFTRL